MKKFIVALSLISGTAFGATTGTLVLTGVVGVLYSLTVNPTTAASNINITAGETATLVATVSETSNNPLGYKITMSSANAGKLKNGTLDETSYQVSYNNGSPVTLTTTPTTVKTVSSMVSMGTVSSDVKVSVTAKPDALVGTYTDTITVTIGAP